MSRHATRRTLEGTSRAGVPQVWKRPVYILVAGVLATHVALASAQGEPQSCEPSAHVANTRPGPPDQPTLVSVGARIFDIAGLDDVSQRAEIDFSTTIRWTDARLAPLENCRLPLSSVWHPQVRITNSGRRSAMFGDYVEIGPRGEVTWMNRFQGTISTRHRIDSFPFDRFLIRISAASLIYSAEAVRVLVDPDGISREAAFTTAGWTIGEPSARTALGKVAGARPDHSFVHVELEASRESEFFVWKVILPLVLIVFMSWGVFWIDPTMFGPQIGLSATSMLTLIAFQFAFEHMIPPLAYFTRMDEFVLGSSALVFLAFSEAIASVYLVGIDQRANAQRLDRISRWVFPVAFASLLAYAFLR